MRNKTKQSREIDNFLNYISDKVEKFSNQNPELKVFISLSVGDDNRGGFASVIAGRRISLKEKISILEGAKNEIINDETKSFAEYLMKEMLK